MIDASRILVGLPQGLRDTLLQTYHKIISNYLERRWEPSELNGGKFAEAVYSIINGAVKNSFPATVKKPDNMVAACRALEGESADAARIGDRSLRLAIPRLLPFLYEIRNNRGVGHVGGDVDANHMDAEAVQAMASWIMAELIRIFHGVSTSEAQQTVDALVERKIPAIWDVEGIKRVLRPGMSTKNQVLLLLHHSTGWVEVKELLTSIEYSNASAFRKKVLMSMHKDRLIEFDVPNGRARVSPLGAKKVDELLRISTP